MAITLELALPIMTISSHSRPDGTVLYLGGDIAETGVLKSDREQKT